MLPSYAAELTSVDGDLNRYPERAFDFQHAGTVLIQQDYSDVGSIVWDAEVVLAHYLDDTGCAAGASPLAGKRVLELGAGTGLAGIVAARLGAHVVLTDQAHLLPQLRRNAHANVPRRCHPQAVMDAPVPPSCTAAGGSGAQQHPLLPTAAGAATAATATPDAVIGHGGASQVRVAAAEHGPAAAAAAQRTNVVAAAGRGPAAAAAELGASAAEQSSCSAEHSDVQVEELLWTADAQQLAALRCRPALSRPFDLVLCCDVVYSEPLYELLIATAASLLAPPPARAIVAFEQRRRDVTPFFDRWLAYGRGDCSAATDCSGSRSDNDTAATNSSGAGTGGASGSSACACSAAESTGGGGGGGDGGSTGAQAWRCDRLTDARALLDAERVAAVKLFSMRRCGSGCSGGSGDCRSEGSSGRARAGSSAGA